MVVPGRIFCLFERSGTFKRAFERLGYVAIDYDICDTEYVERPVDLFAEIEAAYIGQSSLFDDMCVDDLIIAFFPCTEFASDKQLFHTESCFNYRALTSDVIYGRLIRWNIKRAHFYEVLLKLVAVTLRRNLRLIIENPWSPHSYLKTTSIFRKPSIVDWNRRRRGDYFVKPTAFWFINCEPTYGESFAAPRNKLRVQSLPGHDFRRSSISDEYASNFISDFIFGRQRGDFFEHSLF